METFSRESKGHGRASHSAIENVMTSQTERFVWDTLAAHAEMNTDPEADLVSIYTEMVEEVQQEINRTAGRRLSRSTSVMSNLMADIEMEAKVEFVGTLGRRW